MMLLKKLLTILILGLLATACEDPSNSGTPKDPIDNSDDGDRDDNSGGTPDPDPTPDPDLIIRTSGESRLSNFLTWQSVYSELYVSKVLWPDFTLEHLYQALNSYSLRQRRFGKIDHTTPPPSL